MNSFTSSPSFTEETQLYLDVFKEYYNLQSNNRILMAANFKLPAITEIKNNAFLFQEKFKKLEINQEWLLKKFKYFSKNN